MAGDGTSSARRHRRDGLVLGATVGVFGVTFGVLATASGLTVAQAAAMSLLTFTGASQFAVVGVVASGGSPLAALSGALLLAARNAVYGVALAPLLPGRLRARLVAAQLVIDESTAMASAQDDPDTARDAFWVTGLAVFVCWNLGTLLGAVSGQAIGDPGALGLDVAFPAGFLALLSSQLRHRPGRVAALAGGAIAILAIPTTSPGVPVLLAALGALPAWLLQRREAGGRQP